MSLFGALNSSVTGVRAQSDALGIISDNISNVNTTGFKANEANFSALVTGSGTPTSFNPGGVQIRPTLEAGQQGVLDSSDIATDLAVDGNGFFTVKDAVGNVDANELLFTRNGNFRVNDDGDLENANGFLLQGWRLNEDANGDLVPPGDQQNPGSLETVNVTGFSGIARATQNLAVNANVPSTLDISETREVTSRVFDSEGTPHNMQLEFTRDNGNGTTLPPNQLRVDIHAPRLADDPNNTQSGLLDVPGGPLDIDVLDLNGDGDSLRAQANSADGTAGNPPQATLVDEDGDGTPEAADFQIEGTTVRFAISDGTAIDGGGGSAGDPVNGSALSLNDADTVRIDRTGDGRFDAADDVTLFKSDPATLGNNEFDQVSRLSTVVEFQDGGIRRIGTTALNGNLAANSLSALTTLQADDQAELPVGITFNANNSAVPGGTDAAQPQTLNLNLGTPLDQDLNNDGTIQGNEIGVNGKLTDGLTNFDTEFAVNGIEQDGLQFGNFTGVTVGEDGIVTATFSNGERRDIFQLPVATFNNPNGLRALSGTVFGQSPDSGELLLNEAGIGGAGTVAPAALEQSTVDLATEFTKMIETQRAFSSSTRVITTSDEMLQSIINVTR